MARTKESLKRSKIHVNHNIVTVSTRKANPALDGRRPAIIRMKNNDIPKSWNFRKQNRNTYVYPSKNNVRIKFKLNNSDRVELFSLYKPDRWSDASIKRKNDIPAAAVVHVLTSGLVPSVLLNNGSSVIINDEKIPRPFLGAEYNLYKNFNKQIDNIFKITGSFRSKNRLTENDIRKYVRETETNHNGVKFTNDEIKQMINFSGKSLDGKNYIQALKQTGIIRHAPNLTTFRQWNLHTPWYKKQRT